MTQHSKGWVGFDLDGTLAVYDGWKGPEHIGEPIAPMVEYVKELLAQGIEVKIVTARASLSRFIQDEEGYDKVMTAISKWCQRNFGKILEVTAEKDFDMVMLFDDRTVTVEMNTGRALSPMLSADELAEKINWHNSPNNPNSPTYVEPSCIAQGDGDNG